MTRPLLIADIGGTNARFALVAPELHGFIEARTLPCNEFETPEDAVRHYLELTGAESPGIICFAVAGPVKNHAVSFTNNAWEISASNLEATFGCESATLLNDFEAVAWSIPAVNGRHTLAIGDVPERDLREGDFSVCVIGPGTGLGAAGLLKRNGECVPIITEAGHVGFAPENELQREILTALNQKYPRVSDERLVSGRGIRNLYWALGQIYQTPVDELTEPQIFDAIATDRIAAESVSVFFEVLGQAAGNLVLSLGAYDGAYIAGGIAQRHPVHLTGSRLRAGLENKGRHEGLMKAVPTALISHEQPGLLGAAEVASLQFTRRS